LKKIIQAEILLNAKITEDIFEMTLESEYIADYSEAGQFVNIYLDAPQMLLPRPFSICQSDKRKGTFSIVYRAAGEGTKLLSAVPKGKALKIMGPCGTGFTYDNEERIIIVGGGCGAPPLLMLTQEMEGKNKNAVTDVYLGFKNKDCVILEDDFKKTDASVNVSTDDGSYGFSGNVIELLEKNGADADILYACGPRPMLKAACTYARANNIRAQVSLEERMACGIGACLCCVTKVKTEGGYEYEKVCKHGPVFAATEVVFDD